MISGRGRDQRHVHVGERNAGLRKTALGMRRRVVPNVLRHRMAVSHQPPQQRSAVGDRIERRRRRHLRLHAFGIDRERTRRIALLQRDKRLMPGDVAMQQTRAVDRRVASPRSAARHHRPTRPRTSRAPARARRCRSRAGASKPRWVMFAAVTDIAVLGVRPAERDKEEPVVAIVTLPDARTGRRAPDRDRPCRRRRTGRTPPSAGS